MSRKAWLTTNIAFLLFLISASIYTPTSTFVRHAIFPAPTLNPQEKNQALKQMLGHPLRDAEQTSIQQALPYEGAYFSVTLPPSSRINPASQATPSATALETLVADVRSDHTLVVIVAKENNVSTYDDISDIKLRRSQHDRYQEEIEEVQGHRGVSFVMDNTASHDNQTRPEISSYFLINNRLYTLAVTSPTLEDAEKIYQQITSTLDMTSPQE